MDREQAINYLRSSGFSEEQIAEIEQAFKGEPCEDAVNRRSVQETITVSLARGQNPHQLWQKIEDLPPVTVQANKEDIHREREQAYMRGYEDGSRKYRTEQSEDAISRQAVLEYIEGSEAELGHNSENELVCQDIKELPPVAPKPNTGRWILKRKFPTKLYDEYLNEYGCSECYRAIRCTESQLINYPFCHCGAKMGVEE